MVNAGTASKFSPEFRDEAVKMVVKGKRLTAQVARELGINPGTPGNWVAACRKAHPVDNQLNLGSTAPRSWTPIPA